jgi:hypothetical protein
MQSSSSPSPPILKEGGQAWHSIKLPPYSSVGTAHLALPLVQPAGTVEAEAPLSPNTVSWCINLCQVGWGQLLSTSEPDQQDLQPKGITPSLPHPWPATTTAEEGATTQSTALLPMSKALAPCSQFGRGGVVYAPVLLSYTNSGSFVST